MHALTQTQRTADRLLAALPRATDDELAALIDRQALTDGERACLTFARQAIKAPHDEDAADGLYQAWDAQALELLDQADTARALELWRLADACVEAAG
jgi:hypothetical protein